MNATLTTQDISTLKSIRSLPQELATNLRAAMFSSFKHSFGIPQDHKVKVEVDDTTSAVYGVIVRKKNGMTYPLSPATGKWVDPDATPAPTPEPRWFYVGILNAVETIIATCNDFDDGVPSDGMAEDNEPFTVDGHTLRVDEGDLFVLLPSVAFE